jgi:hypothetical protein
MNDAQRRANVQELLRRRHVRNTLISRLHPAQFKAFSDRSQYKSLCASRRGGKTYEDATDLTLALEDSARDEWSVFLAPTGMVGKELIWDELVTMNQSFSLGWRMSEHPTPYVETRTGAKFRILGVDDKAQLGKLRGKKYKRVVADEVKEYAQFMRELVDEIIGPAFMGIEDAQFVASGTPGRICSASDYWYAVNHRLKPGWSAHHWTLHQNPFIKDAEATLRKVLEQKGWTPDNVIYQREYLGLWVSSTDERCYAYNEQRNSVATLDDVFYVDPQGQKHPYDPKTWLHTLGIDYGMKPDPCAWVVWASHPKSRDVFAVYAKKIGELLSDQAASETARLVEKFRPMYIVGDGGGLGKPYIEDFNRRHADRLGIWIHPAEKRGKRDHMEIMSEEFKIPRIYIVLSEAGEYAHELINLGWKNEFREEEHPTQDNHCCDSGLYGFMKHKAMFHQPEKPKPTQDEQYALDRSARFKAAQARQTKGLLR